MRAQYGLQERTFAMTVPYDSVLVGKTLAASRISSAAGLIVMVLERRNSVMTLPSQTNSPGGWRQTDDPGPSRSIQRNAPME